MALRCGGALPLFLPPALFLAPSFLSCALASILLAHKFASLSYARFRLVFSLIGS
jgi:hypothetical protein